MQEIGTYLNRAHKMLQVAKFNLDEGFRTTAVNRAYYAIFYAANALLSTKGIARSKHSAVIASFRQEFVKTGLIEAEFSQIYGRVMDDRNVSDYVIVEEIEFERAKTNLEDAKRFVARLEKHLREGGWI
ncbi:MAG TPA: HEPN domain-containing protein [Anaerolineales bacterium]|nr:HEPN domain-containing protein [Anaerolineales bacterium]